ncbi:MAG: hypothetical protein KIH64_010610, partial [Mycobacterium sp.]|nr:hypothetical protein [Mycobacterium sp.]
MGASGAIGRVGGLAVALGIGAVAATGSLGVAAAEPAPDTSPSTADSTSSVPRGARPDRTRAGRGLAETSRRTRKNNEPSPAAARPAKSGPAVENPAATEVEPRVALQAQANPSRLVSPVTTTVPVSYTHLRAHET